MESRTFDYVEVGKQLLARQTKDWLSSGRFSYAALWLKIVLADPGVARTPLATILSAYDYLPNVIRPARV
jgi:hypothetical protein